MAKHSSRILEMARKGAEQRYEELKIELAWLAQNFPHLFAGKNLARTGQQTNGAGVQPGGKREALSPTRNGKVLDDSHHEADEVTEKGSRPKRSRMSPAARKAASARMKKYWAERRKR